MKLIQKARGFLFDLDGVFVQSDKPLHGAIESLEVLRSLNIPFRFLTNTTTKSRMTLQNTLNSIGINCEEGEIFSAGFSGVSAGVEVISMSLSVVSTGVAVVSTGVSIASAGVIFVAAGVSVVSAGVVVGSTGISVTPPVDGKTG